MEQLRTSWYGLRHVGSQDSFSPDDLRKVLEELRRGVAE
jgi:hypothetical protein